ncbi:bacterio-opsin activator domain-containing protein [Halovivax sp.]|uniref:bacterio-opsin activator domain-containing protein n=1 Tax=Halovivax sp. TaxID=1935978 RepID=UPI0025BD5BC0|nr:bacterio-opsin activator domain-containing protein [Halovivax sp.]
MNTIRTEDVADELPAVLFVAADPTAVEGVCDTLVAEHQMEVTVRSTVADVFGALEARPVDCIVSDVSLPNATGIRLLRAVRGAYPELPFLVFSEVAEEDVVAELLAAGATDYLRAGPSGRHCRLLASRIAVAVERRAIDERRPSPIAGSCFVTDDLSFVAVSEGFSRVLGYDETTLIGRSWTDVWPNDDPKQIRRGRSSDDAESRPTRREIAIRSDDSPILVRRSIDPVEGGFLCLVSPTSDRGLGEIRRTIDPEGIGPALVSATSEARSLDERLEPVVSALAGELDCDYVGVFERRPGEGSVVLRTGVGWTQTFVGHAIDDSPDSHLGYAISATEPVVFESARTESRFDLPAPLAANHVVSGICVPIGSDRRTWGLLGAYTRTAREFSTEDVALARSVGSLLTIVVEAAEARGGLTAVEELLRAAGDDETSETVCELVVDACSAVGALSAAAAYLYDEDGDALRLAARSPRDDGPPEELPFADEGADPRWRTFFDGEPRYVDDVVPWSGSSVENPAFARGIVLALSGHGILVAGAAGSDRPTEPDFAVARIMSAIAGDALVGVDRADRLAAVERERDASVATVDHLTGLLTLIRDVGELIEESRTRGELEAALCERFVAGDDWAFAWTGEYDEVSERIVPRERAGSGRRYLEPLESGEGEWQTDAEPLAAAIDSGEQTVIDRLVSEPSAQRWREEALKRGFRSVRAVPFVFRGLRYGGISLYADRPGANGELDDGVYRSLGTWIGHAINAIETKRALVGGEVVELEFAIEDDRVPFVAWTTRADCSFTFETVLTRPDGSLRGYFTIDGAEADEILSLAAGTTAVTDSRLVTDRDDKLLFESTLTDESVVSRLLDLGAFPKRMTASAGQGMIVVHLPKDADVREFVSAFTRWYPESAVVRQQDREDDAASPYEFGAEFERRLTDRQLEVLQTAYVSGYFDVPREATGTEVADTLDIAQPTFNHHLRAAQRKLFSMLFDEDPSGSN